MSTKKLEEKQFFLPPGLNPTDKAKAGSKHHLITEAFGIPLAVILTGANSHDVKQLIPLIEAIPVIRGRPWLPLWKAPCRARRSRIRFRTSPPGTAPSRHYPDHCKTQHRTRQWPWVPSRAFASKRSSDRPHNRARVPPVSHGLEHRSPHPNPLPRNTHPASG